MSLRLFFIILTVEVLTNFAAAQGIGLNLPQGLKYVVSGNFHECKPQKFLEQVCGICNLVWYYDGAGLYICTPAEMRSSLLELRYMKADDVIEILRELDVEDSRFPMARTKDNALIKISGPPRYVELIQELVAKADSLRRNRLSRDEEVRIFKLKHAWADDVTLGSGDALNGSGGTSVRGVASILQELMGVNNSHSRLQTKEQQENAKKPEDMTADEKAKDELERHSNQGLRTARGAFRVVLRGRGRELDEAVRGGAQRGRARRVCVHRRARPRRTMDKLDAGRASRAHDTSRIEVRREGVPVMPRGAHISCQRHGGGEQRRQ